VNASTEHSASALTLAALWSLRMMCLQASRAKADQAQEVKPARTSASKRAGRAACERQAGGVAAVTARPWPGGRGKPGKRQRLAAKQAALASAEDEAHAR
jgi:hypothetical protein